MAKYNVPPAGIIEAAKDDLLKADEKMLAEQTREFHEAMGLAITKADILRQMTPDEAYNLALQVARRMIAQSVLVQIANIDPKQIL